MRRVALISSASGNGKTTMGRALAERMGVPFVELDALVHGPNWTETPDEVLAARLAPLPGGPAAHLRRGAGVPHPGVPARRRRGMTADGFIAFAG
jgi:hypothetical protein